MDAPRRDEVAARIRDFVVTELMGRPDYPLDDTELLVGGGLIDSFALVRLSVFIEETFGVYVAAADLGPAGDDTVAGMVRRICPAGGSA
jgi:acyl carrier protein